MGWAGPAQPTGPDSAQNCWADFGPKLLGRSRPKKTKSSLLGQTRPRRQGWARIRLAQAQTGGGELFSPHPCMQNATRSACREGKEKENARMRGKKSYLARRRWLAAFLAVLWWRPVAVSLLTGGGSKRRCGCFRRFGSFSPFLPFSSFSRFAFFLLFSGWSSLSSRSSSLFFFPSLSFVLSLPLSLLCFFFFSFLPRPSPLFSAFLGSYL